MTIIAGGSRSGARFWTWHLQRTDGGQSIAVRDAVGLMGQDMAEWFEQMEAMAAGGRTENYFYHFHLSPREEEALTPEQVRVAVATTLENLGLDGQPYFLVEHDKDGRSPHFHCIVLRVDLDTGKAISDSHNYAIHMRTADQLEQRFEQERTRRGRGPDGRNPKGYEVQRGKETGIDPKDVAAELKELWQEADTGQAFAAALDERGYILADGDRGFVVIDQAGGLHSVARRVGARLAEVNARMADIDLETVPSVAEARAHARERAAERQDRQEVPEPDLPAAADSREKSPSTVSGHAQGTVPDIPAAARGREQSQLLVTDPEPPAAEQKRPPPPAPEYSPIALRRPSMFGRLAQKAAGLIGLVRGNRVAESVDPPAQRSQPDAAEGPPPAVAAAVREPVPAASVTPHRPVQEELSPFDRMTAARFEALRAAPGEDGHFTGEAIDWQAREMGTPFLGPISQGEHATPFDRMTGEAFAATRDNGGEPVTTDGSSFWNRARAAIADAWEWVRDTARSFVGRLLQQRERGPNERGRER